MTSFSYDVIASAFIYGDGFYIWGWNALITYEDGMPWFPAVVVMLSGINVILGVICAASVQQGYVVLRRFAQPAGVIHV